MRKSHTPTEWVGATINTLAADNLSVPVGIVQNELRAPPSYRLADNLLILLLFVFHAAVK